MKDNRAYEYREKLRRMSVKELTHFLGISPSLARNLKSALQPGRYEILSNSHYTLAEIAQQLQLSKHTVKCYRYTLKRAGIPLENLSSREKYEECEKRIFDLLNEPKTIKDLLEETGFPKERIERLVRKLEREGKIGSFRLYVGRKGRRCVYTSSQLFGELANRIYYYRLDKEENAANLILQHLPSREAMTKPMKGVLTWHLKRCLPSSLFEKVYQCYSTKSSRYFSH
jgi:DNA-binding Lrp family transcriptional regulator